MRRYSLPKIVFLVGIDGAGKTLLSRMLLEELGKKGINARHAWSRNNNYFSKPLLAFTLLNGLNRKEHHDGFTFQYYEFWKSKLVSNLYIWLQTIDINIATYFKIRRHSRKAELIVCDRGPYDTLVDIMLGTGRDMLDNRHYYKFIRMLPERHSVIYLRRPIQDIIEKRPELKHDTTLSKKEELYTKLQEHFGWFTVDNIDSPDAVLKRIIGQFA